MLRKPVCLLIFAFSLLVSAIQAADAALYLDKITLSGLQTLSAQDIVKSLKYTPNQMYTPELTADIKERLQTYLNQHGYYFSTIEQTDIIPGKNQKVELVFRIEEGFAGYLKDLRLEGNRYFSADKIRQLAEIQPSDRIKLTDLPSVMKNILSLYLSRSFLFAEVGLDSLVEQPEGLAAVIGINEGSPFSPARFTFRGNKVTKPATLLKISGLNQSVQYTPEVIDEAEKRLKERTYIKDCSITPIDAGTLQIAIEEAKMNRIEGVLGLMTNPDNKKRNFSGYLDLQFLNLWGTDRSVGLNWRRPNPDYSKIEINYHESGLNRYPIAGDLLFQNVQQDTSWKSVKVDLNLYYSYVHNKLGTQLYSENLYPGSDAVTDLEATRYYQASAFWEYINTDYNANPSRGYKLRLKGGWLFSRAASGHRSYPVTETNGIMYLPLVPRYVYTIGLHYRELANRKAKVNELYYLGGIASLRGYIEDAFSGWRTGWVNNELGYLMTRDSRIFLFFDAGMLQSGQEKVRTDLMGAGIGLAVSTRLGIINFDYGLPISAKRFTGLASGIIHAGLASSF